MKLLLEPWGLGDALIAASVARTHPEQWAIACQSKWHRVLKAAAKQVGVELQWVPFSVSYSERGGRFHAEAIEQPDDSTQFTEIFSIRGDVRDYWLARKVFPSSKLRFSGWEGFLFRRLRWMDRLHLKLGGEVRNRYDAWARLLEVKLPATSVRATRNPRSIGVHVGAQWGSRRYPWTAELVRLLESRGMNVRVFAGPGDSIPEGVPNDSVQRVVDEAWVSAMMEYDAWIVNDSSPMHLSAFLGRPTYVIARISAIQEWLPPGVIAIESKQMPKGYSPDPLYCTDQIAEGWPNAEEVVERIFLN